MAQKSKGHASVTIDELLDELVRASTTAAEGYLTIEEICAGTGRSRQSVLKALKEAKRSGRLSVGRVLRETIDGRLIPIPAYKISPRR